MNIPPGLLSGSFFCYPCSWAKWQREQEAHRVPAKHVPVPTTGCIAVPPSCLRAIFLTWKESVQFEEQRLQVPSQRVKTFQLSPSYERELLTASTAQWGYPKPFHSTPGPMWVGTCLP